MKMDLTWKKLLGEGLSNQQIETMLILDAINNYLSYWDKMLGEDFFWKEERRKLVKYRPFLDFDVDKYKVIVYSRIQKYDESHINSHI